MNKDLDLRLIPLTDFREKTDLIYKAFNSDSLDKLRGVVNTAFASNTLDFESISTILEVAVENNPEILRYIKVEKQHFLHGRDFFKNDPTLILKLSTPADSLILEVAELDIEVIGLIPSKHISKELVNKLIKVNPYVLAQLPDELITQELCYEAIKYEPKSLQVVPERFQTDDLIESAIRADYSTFEFVINKTKDLANLSVQSYIAKVDSMFHK